MKIYCLLISLLLFQFSFAQKQKVLLKESSNIQDTKFDYLEDEIQPIRDNFKRINSIKKWTKITTYETDDSTEGGYINYYYLNKSLEKIVVRKFGESGQYLAEYYFKDNQLSFLFEKVLDYNAPLYWKEFDYKKSDITEDRYYFKSKQLLHIMSNKDCGAPFAETYLKDEQKRVFNELSDILKSEKLAKSGVRN